MNKLRDRLEDKRLEIRRNIYENEKNLSASKMKEIEKNLELGNNFSKLKKYYDHDDTECKRIRDVRNLFGLPIDENYYKPIITNDAFNSNYIEYESKENKDWILSIREYLNMIRLYFRDIIKNHKKWKVHSGNTVIDYKTQGEWKIQLTMIINLISSKDSDETHIAHTESDNIEIMMGSETDYIIKELAEYHEGLEESKRWK